MARSKSRKEKLKAQKARMRNLRAATKEQELIENSRLRASERQKKNTLAHAIARTNLKRKQEEQQKNTQAHAISRTNLKRKQEEQQKNTQARAISRTNLKRRQEEQQKNTQAHAISRTNLKRKQEEQQKNTQAHAISRTNLKRRREEQQKDTRARAISRTNLKRRQEEQQKNTQARAISRTNLERRRDEQRINSIQRNQARDKRTTSSWEIVKQKFLKNVMEGPTHICMCCDRLFFAKSVSIIKTTDIIQKHCNESFLNQILLSQYSQFDELKFCSTCFVSIKNKRIPRLCINTSKLQFPEIPSIVSELSLLEERCVAPRIPFMKIFALGIGRQFGIRGGIVNVPVEVDTMVSAIPRLPSATNTIQLKLKRKLGYTQHYMYETISPTRIHQAAEYLVTTDLYKEHNITLDNTLLDENIEQFGENDNDETESASIVEGEHEEIESNIEENQIPEETLLDCRDVIEFAPGEGNFPQSLLFDGDAEELAFPTIYGGERRKTTIKNYDTIVNSEIRRSDRRAVRPDHLLFMHKKSQLEKVKNNITTALRKKSTGQQITVGTVLNDDLMVDLLNRDEGYSFLRGIVGTPPYWENQKKNLLAMVRQLGICTFFITLSAAETKWTELLKILKSTVDKEFDANVENLDFQEKSRLIKSDPVTCAIYFEHRFKELKQTWNYETGPFKNYKIKDLYYRIEFQHRGSPHVHMLVWLENSPVYDPENDASAENVCKFIDEIVTCNSNEETVEEEIQYQYHTCSFTCKKMIRGKQVCRFNAPFYPMDETIILSPYSPEPSEKQNLKEIIEQVKAVLENVPSNIQSLDDLISTINITKDLYILAIRASLNSPKIFLKRSIKDTRVNAFSPKILGLMKSNMDIQFVLDVYACVGYVVDYINKSQRGLSKLLREAVEDVRQGNLSIRQKLKRVGNVFYNGTEISAQEAAWCHLRLPMSHSSTVVEFINTNPPSKRTRIVKSKVKLNKLYEKDPNSIDIFENGPIERYIKRPDQLNQCCLADFVACYSFSANNSQQCNNDNGEIENIETVEEELEGSRITMHGLGVLRKRKTPKIIRFRKFNINSDRENFFREIIMLFWPWKNEDRDLINCEQIYKDNKESIDKIRKKYYAFDGDLNEIYKEISNDRAEPNETNETEMNVVEFEPAYDYDENERRPNIMVDLGQESGIDTSKKFSCPDQLSDSDYQELVISLNTKQRQYLMHCVNCFKTQNNLPIYHFITGGAGVGKSRLIKAIYQSLCQILRKQRGSHGDVEILLIAPTGKAAHNIGGMTAHSVFSLPVNQLHGPSISLSPDLSNTLASKLYNLKLIIIDEVSMLGSKQFFNINQRLQQIFKMPNIPFANVSIITFGDFNQLRPVGDRFIFQSRRDDLAELVTNPLWEKFSMFELTEIMRQRDDLQFAEALTRMTTGTMNINDIALFKSRVFKNHNSLTDSAKKAIHLYATNDEVQEYNNFRTNELLNSECFREESVAQDTVTGNGNTKQRENALKQAEKLDCQKAYGLPIKVLLQTGIRYMITNNIDVEDGLFNGASGILKKIEKRRNSSIAWIEFTPSSIGSKARSKLNRGISNEMSWTPILKIKKQIITMKNAQLQVHRFQFPLIIAEGITVHKSQGQSMSEVVVDLRNRKDRELSYVAYSRATNLGGLFILGNFTPPKPPLPTHPVVIEMARLRENLLVPKFNFLSDIPNGKCQFISHNVQSLKKHYQNINSDEIYINSDILLLQETWVKNSDSIQLNGFEEIIRNFYLNSAAQGTSIFAKSFFLNNCLSPAQHIFKNNLQHIDITICKIKSVYVFNIYKNPKCTANFLKTSLQNFESIFRNNKVLMVGDFNENVQNANNWLENFLSDFNFKLISPRNQPTTDSNTTIDVVFTNLDLPVEVYIYESLFSYHKPLIIRLDVNFL